MFTFCPSCASKKIKFEKERVFLCPDCGFTYYHNIAAATACIINANSGLLFLERVKDPGRGKLDLPGGFIDPGEGAIEGIRREVREELGLELASMGIHGGAPMQTKKHELRFFCSFPNKYLYKNIMYNTCDLFFLFNAPDLSEKDLKLDTDENSSVLFIKPEELDMEKIAFESVKKALQLFIADVH